MEKTTRHSKFTQYFIDSWTELSKTTWPTKVQAVNICVLVVSFVFVAAIVFAGVDYLFNKGYTYLLDLPINANTSATPSSTVAVPGATATVETESGVTAPIKAEPITVVPEVK